MTRNAGRCKDFLGLTSRVSRARGLTLCAGVVTPCGMVATRQPRQISQPLVAVGAVMREGTNEGSWADVTASLNAVYGLTRAPTIVAVADIAIPAGTTWTECWRADIHVQHDLGTQIATFRGVGAGGTTQARLVEDPDGAATVLGTVTLPTTSGVVDTSFSVTPGDLTIAVQVRDTGAGAGGTLNAVYMAPDEV